MPYHNPKEVEPFDFEKLLALSLAEQDGKPVLHMDIELKQHREYDPEIASLFLPSVDPRRLYPETHPDKDAVGDTDKQEVVQAPAEPESSKSSKKAKSDASQESAQSGSEPAKTGQGG